MFDFIRRYSHWLHGKWPAGAVEQGPDVTDDGTCDVRGVRIVGDLTGIPLLKFSADSGAKAVLAILNEKDFEKGGDEETLDLPSSARASRACPRPSKRPRPT